MKIFVLALLLSLSLVTHAQQLMDLKVKPIEGDSVALSTFGGHKLLFMVLPVLETDSMFAQLETFCESYTDSLQIVGILSFEDGYTDSVRDGIIDLYKNLPILLLDGLHTKGNEDNQCSLIRWLTHGAQNTYADSEVSGIGQKYFVNKWAHLYAILPAQVSLQSPTVEAIMTVTTPPFPREQTP